MKALAFALLPALIALTAAELLARARWTEQELRLDTQTLFLRDDPTLFWTQRPGLDVPIRGGVRLKTNGLGLRDDEVMLPRPTETYRVLSLGESSTWGDQVEAEQTYSQQLEGLLNREKGQRHFEVINAGVGAYTIWQSYIYLREKGLALDPQMVLIYHQLNDFLPSHVVDARNPLYKVDGTDRQLYERRARVRWLLAGLLHSRLYQALRRWLLLRPTQLPTLTPGMRPAGVRVPLEDRQVALEGLRDLCQARGVVLVVLQPFYAHLRAEDDLLRSFSAANRLPYVDLPRLLALHRRGGQPLFFIDDVHPTPLGHRLIAEALVGPVIEAASPR